MASDDRGTPSFFEQAGTNPADFDVETQFGCLRANFLNLIDQYYSGRQELGQRLSAMSHVRSAIEEQFGPEIDDKEKYEFMTKAREVFAELITDFIDEKVVEFRTTADQNANKEMQAGLNRLYDSFFESSATPYEYIPAKTMLRIGTKTSRNPALQGFLGLTVTAGATESLGYSGEEAISEVIEAYETETTPEILDFLNFATTVGANALAEGYRSAEVAYRHIVRIIEQIKQKRKEQIVCYACDLALERLQEEIEDPSTSILKYPNDVSNARLTEWLDDDTADQDRELRQNIEVKNVKLGKSGRLSWVASDCIAILDHSNLPRYYFRADPDQLPHRTDPGISPDVLRSIEDWLETDDLSQPAQDGRHLINTVFEISNEISEPYSQTYINDGDSFAERWHEISDVLEQDEWKELYESVLKVDEGSRLGQKRYYALKSKLNNHEIDQNQFQTEQDKLNENQVATYSSFAVRMNQLTTKIKDNFSRFANQTKEFLSRVAENEKRSRLEVTPISYDEINRDVTINPFNKNEADLPLLMKHLHKPAMRKLVEADLHFSLTDLPLNSQVHLLRYLSEKNDSTFGQLREIADSKEEIASNFLESFLACSESQAIGDLLLSIAQSLPTDDARVIFSAYVEIGRSISEIKQFAQSSLNSGSEINEEQVSAIVTKLLNKGKRFLDETATKLALSASQRQELDDIKGETALFATLFGTLLESGDKVDFENFSNIRREVIAAPELSSIDREQMAAIFEANWGKPEFQAIYEAIRPGFYDGLNRDSCRFHLIKQAMGNGQEEIITFQRFEELAPGVIYAASNNVKQEARGDRIGEAAQKAILAKEAESNVVVASVFLKLPVMSHYINKSGFVATGLYEDFSNSGQPFLCLVEDLDANPGYKYHDLDPGAIMRLCAEGNSDIIEADLNGSSILGLLEDKFRDNQVITSFVRNPVDSTVYLAFEPDRSKIHARVENNKLRTADHEEALIAA